MSQCLKHLQRILLSLATLVSLALLPVRASGQVFDQFRLLGDHSGLSTGFVTSISFERESSRATLNYLNVAGAGYELTVELTPSQSIQSALPVFLPAAEFLQPPPPALDLSGIEFFQGTIAPLEGVATPAHWFRLSYFNNQWSGVFRIDRRIYSIDRYSQDDPISVRPATSGDLSFLPDQRIKVSAVVDESYVQSDTVGDLSGMDNLGHLFALESIHVMDGLLADSLGITCLLYTSPSPRDS